MEKVRSVSGTRPLCPVSVQPPRHHHETIPLAGRYN
ncbi:hypothetical protein A2U01_0063356, partial [Trifolium medium]|nr:hypothetical protein [Trifolium medium]